MRSLVLGGLGMQLVDGVGLPESIAEALEAPSLADVTDPQGRMFRAFADQTKSDRRALAACIRGSRQVLTREQAASIKTPVLIAVGTKDDDRRLAAGTCGDHAERAGARRFPNRDHMLAVGDKVFKAGVLQFLEERAMTRPRSRQRRLGDVQGASGNKLVGDVLRRGGRRRCCCCTAAGRPATPGARPAS